MGLFGNVGGFGRGGMGIASGDDWMMEWLSRQQGGFGGMDQPTQQAVDDYASMPAPQQGGGVGGFLQKLGGMGDAFAQAGAMMSGEWGTAADIAQRRSQLQGLKAKQQSDAAEQEQIIAGLMEQGLTRSQAVLVARNAAAYGDFKQKAPEQPGFIRDAEAYAALPDDKKRIVESYMDMSNPRFTNTPQGTQFIPRTTIPPGLTPMTEEEIRQRGLGAGGPTQPASGGFRFRR